MIDSIFREPPSSVSLWCFSALSWVHHFERTTAKSVLNSAFLVSGNSPTEEFPDVGYVGNNSKALVRVHVFGLQVGQGYPHDPPKVKCETMVYHPNIDLEGNVCLNILR